MLNSKTKISAPRRILSGKTISVAKIKNILTVKKFDNNSFIFLFSLLASIFYYI